MTEPSGSEHERERRWLELARQIGDSRPIDWTTVAGPEGTLAGDATGFHNLERLAAAHARVAREFDERPEAEVGSVLSHYRIVSRLGSGSMGVVYRAQDERLQLDRTVALKVVHPECAGNETARQILLREARIACSFAHPNVATIFEVGEENERVFIAMEYVAGKTLSETLRHRPLSVDTVVDYGIQIASALEAAHEAGIIHRDLKSSNIVVTPAGAVKVLDFGVAVRTSSGTLESPGLDAYGPVGWTAGTLPYMAPESLRGEPPDRRCDIWALGVTLHEALTGTRPFHAEGRADLERAIHLDAPAPLPASVPMQLRRVIERCLQKNPAQRYQRAGEIRAALEAIRDGRRPGRRSVITVAAAALAALAVVILVGTHGWRLGLGGKGASVPSLVVLPAHNTSGLQAEQFLADGLTDELINTLMRLSSIRVLSRQSSYAIAREQVPLPALARRHDIDLVLESSIVQVGERVRVNVQLVEAKSDRQVWAQSYERPVRETLALDREIVRGVATRLKLPLTGGEATALGPAPPVDRAVYQEYVLGRNFAAERNYRRAVECYTHATRMDPLFAAAYSGLAECYIEMLYYRDVAPEVTLARAGAAAQRALAIDSTQASAHLALAYVHGIQWDWPAAKIELERALEDEPGSPEVWYGWSFYHGVLGETEAEVDAMARAVQGDPLSGRYANELGLAYLNARRLDDAEAQFLRVQRAAESEESRRAEAYRARCLAIRGQAAKAVAALQAMARRSDARENPPYVREELAYALARAGHSAESKRLIADLHRDEALASPLAIAAAEIAVGEPESAFDTLFRASARHDSRILWIRVDQRFDPIRKDPRYAKLLERMVASGPRA